MKQVVWLVVDCMYDIIHSVKYIPYSEKPPKIDARRLQDVSFSDTPGWIKKLAQIEPRRVPDGSRGPSRRAKNEAWKRFGKASKKK